MQSILANWKTSLAGVVLIVVGALTALLGIYVPVSLSSLGRR